MIGVVKAKYVAMGPLPLIGASVSIGPHFLGFHVYDWGLRLMLIWWHLCWSWSMSKKRKP